MKYLPVLQNQDEGVLSDNVGIQLEHISPNDSSAISETTVIAPHDGITSAPTHTLTNEGHSHAASPPLPELDMESQKLVLSNESEGRETAPGCISRHISCPLLLFVVLSLFLWSELWVVLMYQLLA